MEQSAQGPDGEGGPFDQLPDGLRAQVGALSALSRRYRWPSWPVCDEPCDVVAAVEAWDDALAEAREAHRIAREAAGRQRERARLAANGAI